MDDEEKQGHVKVGNDVRSGDTHVIDPTVDHADAVNVDQLAREAAAAEAATEAQREFSRDELAAEMDRLVGLGFAEAYDKKLRKAELAALVAAGLEREASGARLAPPPAELDPKDGA